jgi:porin
VREIPGARSVRRATVVVGVIAAFVFSVCAQVRAQQAASDHPYSGDIFDRSTLTGDWDGYRNYLADKGLTFDLNVTQIEQGVVDGGKSGAWEYGGRGDLTGHLDTQKLGLWAGGFLTVELEGNWSHSVNLNTGALLPANTSQLFPLPGGQNVALPDLSYTQFFSRYAGVFVGKLQTITNGDTNEFAHGKGDSQFYNLAFNLNPVALVVPYSTLGTGLIILPTADPNKAIITLNVVSATGKASTTGFNNMNGAIFAGQGRLRTNFFGLTGHQLVGALYSNKPYTSVDQRLDFVLTQKLRKRDGSWAVYYNFDQYLYEIKKDADRGIGLFGRFGASKGDPVPVQYFYSAGVGAKGLIASRALDQFGIGYYYSSINNPTLQIPTSTISFLRDEWGFEAYYNAALTPWLLLTPDVQVIGPAQKKQLTNRRFIETGTVLGARLQILL